ncbi:hypothetical protein UFOVP1382_179 [uncultured Caudovirales phage]|uniref:Uncharacterized protein n=1 Tax=uncultured Caudovirales phage TaxID=2100421 RepID=A0A6J5S5B3_9CAUD|nr:hypothetical protein UFOVP1382_179 [uncultured Caudovirales phage]
MTAPARSLTEDFNAMGLRDVNSVLMLSGLPSVTAAEAPPVTHGTVEEAAKAIFEGVMAELTDDEIEGDKAQYESDLRASILTRLKKEVSEGKSLKEAGDVVADTLVERMKKARERRVRISASGKRTRFVATRKRGAAAVKAKRSYRRWKSRGGVKRKARSERRGKRMRQKRISARIRGESTADDLRALLNESAADTSTLTDTMVDVLEAHDRIATCASLLADFFESDGTDEDKALVAVLDEMVQAIDAREPAVLEGKSDEASEMKRLGTFMKVLAGAVDQFERYEFQPEGDGAGNA